jgi:hypothetical protein
VRVPLHGLRVDGTEKWLKLEPRPKLKTRYAITGGEFRNPVFVREVTCAHARARAEVCVSFSEPPAVGTEVKISNNVIEDIKTRIKTALVRTSLCVFVVFKMCVHAAHQGDRRRSQLVQSRQTAQRSVAEFGV